LAASGKGATVLLLRLGPVPSAHVRTQWGVFTPPGPRFWTAETARRPNLAHVQPSLPPFWSPGRALGAPTLSGPARRGKPQARRQRARPTPKGGIGVAGRDGRRRPGRGPVARIFRFAGRARPWRNRGRVAGPPPKAKKKKRPTWAEKTVGVIRAHVGLTRQNGPPPRAMGPKVVPFRPRSRSGRLRFQGDVWFTQCIAPETEESKEISQKRRFTARSPAGPFFFFSGGRIARPRGGV